GSASRLSTRTPFFVSSNASTHAMSSAAGRVLVLPSSNVSLSVTAAAFGLSQPLTRARLFCSLSERWTSMPQSNLPILIIEDSPEDYEAIVRALGKLGVANPIYRFSYGEDAFDFLKHRGPFFKHGAETRPGLLILDLNLPERSGHEVLRQIRSDPALELIPVVVLSSSANLREAERCYQAGANSYIV